MLQFNLQLKTQEICFMIIITIMNWIKTEQDLNELKAMIDYHIDEFRIEIETFWDPKLKTKYDKRRFFDCQYSVNALDVLCQFSAFLVTNPSFDQINQVIKDLDCDELDQPLGWQKRC